MSQRGVDLLKEFSERHEEYREPFEQWRSRVLDRLKPNTVWIIEMTRASFQGHWIQAENIFYFSEIAACEKAAWLRSHEGLCWEYRVGRYERT